MDGRPVTRGELIDAGHELAHSDAKKTFHPGTPFALIKSAATLAMVSPFPSECATERLAVAAAGPLFDMRVSGKIKSNCTDDVADALIRYIKDADTGEDDCDSGLFRAAMEELRDDPDALAQINDAFCVAMRASRTACQIYTHRRKALAKIALDLRSLGPNECLVFAPDAVTRLLINMPPDLTVRDLGEWLVECQDQYQTADAINSPLEREPKP